MAWILQDFKFGIGDQVGEMLEQLPIPEDVTAKKVVRDRMASHFEAKTADGVRVIDEASGEEIYRWTFWDEQKRRNERALKRHQDKRRAKSDSGQNE